MNIPLSGKTDFFFWGERKYVHSSHLFPEFLSFLDHSNDRKVKRIIMDFKSQVTTNGQFVVIDDSDLDKYPVITQVFFHDGQMTRFGLDVQDGGPVSRHLPDDEGELIADGKINKEDQKAYINKYDPARLVGVLVALVKKLHLSCLSLDGFGQWLVGRLDVDMEMYKNRPDKPLSVALVQNMANSMTRSQAWLGSKPFAQVGFFRRKQSD